MNLYKLYRLSISWPFNELKGLAQAVTEHGGEDTERFLGRRRRLAVLGRRRRRLKRRITLRLGRLDLFTRHGLQSTCGTFLLGPCRLGGRVGLAQQQAIMLVENFVKTQRSRIFCQNPSSRSFFSAPRTSTTQNRLRDASRSCGHGHSLAAVGAETRVGGQACLPVSGTKANNGLSIHHVNGISNRKAAIEAMVETAESLLQKACRRRRRHTSSWPANGAECDYAFTKQPTPPTSNFTLSTHALVHGSGFPRV